jgi:hypothetical protein
MPTINDLLTGYQSMQEARTSARRQAIINNADIWFGDLLGELSPGAVVVRSSSTVIPVSYAAVNGEISMDIQGNAALKFFTTVPPSIPKSINLPFYTWGKDRFATPVDGQALAELLLSVAPQEV